MKRIRIITLILACFCFKTTISTAQNTQTIRGRILDAATQQPLVEASVVLDEGSTKTTTNTEGVFRFEKIPVGRHTLRVGFVGFENLFVSDILLESGKEIVLDLSLKSWAINTDTLVVTAQREQYFDAINGIQNERLTRYPATFNDPARLLTYLPGAATTNDQGNNISVRGSSPNMNQWYLNGAEVVNPNHLTNAGTKNDQATVNGGGVLIPGFNVMGGTQFYKGAMSADMGGALTSVMDIGLRKGNDEHRETQVSLGLIGTEIGTEGYFSPPPPKGGEVTSSPFEGRRASYLVHYRYSTLGLLSKLGVKLGDEDINYQDLSINLNFPTKKAGTFNLFGIYGASENVFTHLPNRREWEVDKDSQDITYRNKMGAIGFRHEIAIGKKAQLTSVAAYSGLANQRMAIGFSLNDVPVKVDNIDNQPTKLFLKSVFNYALDAKQNLKIGMVARQDEFQFLGTFKESVNDYKFPIYKSSWWLQPSLEWQSKWTDNWTTQIGLRLVQWNNLQNRKQNETTLEPIANIQYTASNRSLVTLAFSTQTQMLSPQLTTPRFRFVTGSDYSENITKSHNLNFAYNLKMSKNIVAKAEAYYQYIFDASTLSLNAIEGGYGGSISKGRNMGIEIDVQQQLNEGFYWRANVSIFDSKYQVGSNWKDTQFNGRYISNALVGKEWALGSLKNRFLGVNVHQILRGGYFDFYTNKNLKDYFRTDLNVYFKRSHTRYSSTVQLDLQNLTNQQNVGWHYFDHHKGQVWTQYQLGLIPNLAYKIAF
jgi:hypothetical protein